MSTTQYNDIFKNKRPWYGAKSIFYDEENAVYEERIIVLRADSYDEALNKAKEEADEYADSLPQVKYVGYSEVFNLFDDEIADGSEVYSVMRKSALNAEQYLHTFINTGDEIGIEREEV